MTGMLRIQVTTLREIIDAIEASGRITVRIQISPLDAERNIIPRRLLGKIADEIRAFDGTTDEILIKNLAARVLELNDAPQIIKLATPIIALYDDDGIIEPEYTTSAILGEAILGYCILGSAGDGITIKQLDTPVIYLVEEEDGDTTTKIIKLDTPIIYLEEVPDDSGEEEPEVTIIQLATPVIELYEETEEPEVPEEPDVPEEPEITVIQLVTPVIYLDEIKEDIPDEPIEPEPTIVQLDTPIIYLEEVKEEEEEKPVEPTIVQLATPEIYLEVIEDETEEPDVPDVPVEPTIVQLDTPVIELVEIEDAIPDAPVEPDEPEEPDEPTVVQLATPIIELVEIKEDVEPEEPDVQEGLVRMTYNSSGYINSNGEFFEPSGLGLKYSQLISLWILANGSDGWCVWSEFSSPTEIKIFYYDNDNKLVGTLGYEDYLSRGLTAEFIVGYAANNYPTATQAIFTLDTSANDAVDAIYVYEVEEEEEYKLATPVIELVVA